MSDRNFHSIADCDGFDLPELVIDLPAAGVDAGQFDDVLKFSNARNGHIGHLVIRTGGGQHENAIDFNRSCRNIRIDRAEIEAGAQNAITAKGGCHGLYFGVVEITRAGGHCDIELGNHSDQVYERTTVVTFESLKRSDGQPTRIRAEYADWPVVIAGATQRQALVSALIRLYVQLKHVAPFIPALFLVLAFAGCSLIPSGWRIGGSPLDKVEKKEATKTEAREQVLKGAQEAVHKANLAGGEVRSTDRSFLLTQEFLVEGQDLLDQALGAPPAATAEAWRSLVSRLLSENAEIRKQAESERVTDRDENRRLSERLTQATAMAQRANSRALDYARESEGLADIVRKLKLGFFALLGLIALGTVLSLVARFVPSLGMASKVINGLVAPGITFVANRAEEGLKRVGKGIAGMRASGTDVEGLIEKYLNGVTDADHQAIIAAAATAAGNGPPASVP